MAAGAVCALIPAAGRGVRFGGSDNKVFVPLLGRPLLAWTLDAFAHCDAIDAIVLIGSEPDVPRLRELADRYGGGKFLDAVIGGQDRQSSVRNGLAACAEFEYVAVHDAARPCVTPILIDSAVKDGRTFGATTVAVPVADTLVPGVESMLRGEDVPRDGLYAIQTPQVFARQLLCEAHDAAQRDGMHATDDAGLVRRLRGSTHQTPGSPENIKVTRPEDLALAEAVLAYRAGPSPTRTATPTIRIGHGYDVHPFAAGRRLFLGGIEFPDAPRGLLGHSDADVVLHAVCDALLGAAGMGDIGMLFPPSDMAHKDRRSTEFLGEVHARITAAGWHVGNVDVTILAEAPRIGPKADEMRRNIATQLDITPEQIGIKATTSEGLGFVGRGEGIAAHATALLLRQPF
jgi:2-C-methyl-D-erythritol 4-phosphate cytidylyltransferase/2-C-methyl-D-erythritol 2,4-cyclodiphosphate synthase